MLTDSFNFSVQLFLGLGIPALVAALVVGVVGGIAESFLGLKGSGLKYALKFALVICLIYLFSGTAVSQIQGQLTYILSR